MCDAPGESTRAHHSLSEETLEHVRHILRRPHSIRTVDDAMVTESDEQWNAGLVLDTQKHAHRATHDPVAIVLPDFEGTLVALPQGPVCSGTRSRMGRNSGSNGTDRSPCRHMRAS